MWSYHSSPTSDAGEMEGYGQGRPHFYSIGIFFLFTYLFILTFFYILETMSSFTITGCYIEIGWIIAEEVNSWPNFRGWLSRERLITVQSDAIDDLRSCSHRIIELFDQLSLSVFCKKKFRSFALDLVGCLAGILERMGRVTLNLSCINSNGVYLFLLGY